MKILSSIILMLMMLTGCSSKYPCDKPFHRILGAWVKESKKIGLVAVGTGGGIKDEKIRSLGVSFETKEMMSLETAREKMIECYGLLLNILDQYPEYDEFFSEGEFNINIASFDIGGPIPEDPHIDYISAALLVLGNISYYRLDPETNSYPSIEVHEETYEEALEIVQQGSTSVTQAEPA